MPTYGQRLQADMYSENNNVKLLESECFFLYKKESISFFNKTLNSDLKFLDEEHWYTQ